MSFFTDTIDFVQVCITALGIVFGIVGSTKLAESFTDNNAGERTKAMGFFVGAGILIGAAAKLVPALASVFS